MRAAKSLKAEELKNSVEAIINSCDKYIKDLSEQLDIPEQIIQNLVNGDTHYKKQCEPNMFNALIHKMSEEMNTGNITPTIYFL